LKFIKIERNKNYIVLAINTLLHIEEIIMIIDFCELPNVQYISWSYRMSAIYIWINCTASLRNMSLVKPVLSFTLLMKSMVDKQ